MLFRNQIFYVLLILYFSTGFLFSQNEESWHILVGCKNEDGKKIEDCINKLKNYNNPRLIFSLKNKRDRIWEITGDINPTKYNISVPTHVQEGSIKGMKAFVWIKQNSDLSQFFDIEFPNDIDDIEEMSIKLNYVGTPYNEPAFNFSRNDFKINGKPASVKIDKIDNLDAEDPDSLISFSKIKERGNNKILSGVSADCFKKGSINNRKYYLDIVNNTDQDLAIEVRAECGCIGGGKGCQPYPYSFINSEDIGTNKVSVEAKGDAEIALNNSNWSQLQYSILKDKHEPSEFMNFSGQEIIITKSLISRLFKEGADEEYTFDEYTWNSNELKDIEYIYSGISYSEKAKETVKFPANFIRHLTVNGKSARIDKNSNKIVKYKPILVIVDFNITSGSNKKGKKAYKNKIKELFNDNHVVHFYKFQQIYPRDIGQFESLLFRTVNTKLSKYNKITTDNFNDFSNWVMNNKDFEEVKGTPSWVKKNFWIYEPILSDNEFNFIQYSNIREDATNEKYLNSVFSFDAIENIDMYSKIYYLTGSEPEDIDASKIKNNMKIISVSNVNKNEF